MVQCVTCKKDFKTIPARIGNGRGRFCSKLCFNKWRKNNVRGSNHKGWRGGKVTVSCIVCGKAKSYFPGRIKTGMGKYCSRKCSSIAQRGRKFPHTKEWEERRLAAIRESSKNRIYVRGYKRPKEHTQPMIDALNKKRVENPEKYKQAAIRNLSKDKSLNLSKENSPNWRGGITADWQKWKSANGKRFGEWRRIVHERDNHKCKLCGSTKKLEAHHIIPIAECRDVAFLPMNGVLLCGECHKKTDSFGGKAHKERSPKIVGDVSCILATIQHRFQTYETVGNYQWTESGMLVVFVSEMPDKLYEGLIFLHEYVEATLCGSRGISEQSITAFDIEFEKNRAHELRSLRRQIGKFKKGWYRNRAIEIKITQVEGKEAGDDPKAPYRKEHQFATMVEKAVCHELGINWDKYDKTIMSL